MRTSLLHWRLKFSQRLESEKSFKTEVVVVFWKNSTACSTLKVSHLTKPSFFCFFFLGGGVSLFFFPLSLHLYTYYVVSIAYVLPPDTYNKPDS